MAREKGRTEVCVPRCIVPFMIFFLFVCGCASHQKELLAKDYTVMTNDELIRYYYELNDEIIRCVNESSSAAVGVGTGFGLRRLGLWLGLSHGIPTCNPENLRKRRIDVRIEMQHRGLNP